jgi:RNA polymerase sigma factor (sigma-70 family)
VGSLGASRIDVSNFSPRSPVEVMKSSVSSGTPANARAVLQSFVGSERGRALRVQLATRHRDRSAEEIEDAIQAACKCFLDEAEGISAPGQVYSWLRTAAHRILSHEAERKRREVAVDPVEDRLGRIATDRPGPAEELISLEDDADLARFVKVVTSSLSERRRNVLALYAAGCKGSEIADRLGLTEPTVRRDLHEIRDRARAVVARLAGGGCARGEPLVIRFVCGLSSKDESAHANEHLSQCERCRVFCERLIAWREKAGAMLPAPVAEGAHPGVVERIVQGSADRLAAVKQQILDGGAQLKQQAVTGYYRAVDPTPLAAARPGTVAAVVASCVAIGGGAAACVEKGVNPIGAASGLIAAASENEPTAAPPPEPEAQAPVYTPAEPLPESEQAAPEPPAPPAEQAPEPKPKPEPPAPPAPDESIEPVAQPSTEGESAPAQSVRPAPVAMPSSSGEFEP